VIANGDASGTSYAYFQDSDGNIRERAMRGFVWSGGSSGAGDLVAAKSIAKNSTAIAATAYPSGNMIYVSGLGILYLSMTRH
jgi:hypothetical protein